MKTWKLTRTTQCSKCPWKVDTDPFDIPDGYDVEKHKNLKSTIADNTLFDPDKPLKIMACHHSKIGNEQHCVGWLWNQIGTGNNIGLRISMMSCENAKDITIVGEQHELFEDTLPFSKKNNHGTKFKD
jgi:hypothetical protein